jgi:ribosome maturation factor RimP
MYRDSPPELLRVVEPIARDHGLEVVEAALRQAGPRSRLQLILDTPAGDGRVGVEQCAAVSREVGHALDACGLIDGAYTLEVTSPGVDRTLGREIDFERAVGRTVALETREPLDGRRRFKGELRAFEQSRASVHTEAGDFAIPFERIARATAFFPFPAQGSKR